MGKYLYFSILITWVENPFLLENSCRHTHRLPFYVFFLYLNKLSWTINLDTLRRWWSSPTQKMSPLRQSGKKMNRNILNMNIFGMQNIQVQCDEPQNQPRLCVLVCSLDQVPRSVFTGPGT